MPFYQGLSLPPLPLLSVNQQWKLSLTLQIQELNRCELEVKVRLEQIQQMEEEFKYLGQQDREIKKIPLHQPLGTILQQAGLVSAEQLQVALKDQLRYPNVRVGEIIALRGWLKQETADFFAQQWTELQEDKGKHPLGFVKK